MSRFNRWMASAGNSLKMGICWSLCMCGYTEGGCDEAAGLCLHVYTTTLISCTKSTPSCPFMGRRGSVWVSYFFGIDGTCGLHNTPVSHIHRQQTHSVSIVEPPLVQAWSLEQPAKPEAKEGQIGKTLRGPFVTAAPLALVSSSLLISPQHFALISFDSWMRPNQCRVKISAYAPAEVR